MKVGDFVTVGDTTGLYEIVAESVTHFYLRALGATRWGKPVKRRIPKELEGALHIVKEGVDVLDDPAK